MSNAKHAATYRAKQLAKASAMAKRVEELEEALQDIACGGYDWLDEPVAAKMRFTAAKALEGRAKP